MKPTYRQDYHLVNMIVMTMITIMMMMVIFIMVMMMMMATPIHLHDLDMMTIDISSIEYFNCCQKLQFIHQYSSI